MDEVMLSQPMEVFSDVNDSLNRVDVFVNLEASGS